MLLLLDLWMMLLLLDLWMMLLLLPDSAAGSISQLPPCPGLLLLRLFRGLLPTTKKKKMEKQPKKQKQTKRKKRWRKSEGRAQRQR
jgi:hypothetical protein